MSFILDALKKLEQKRQQDSVPNLNTIHTTQLYRSHKRPLWPYLLFGALLLNAGILTVWLSPWSSESQDTAAYSLSGNKQNTPVSGQSAHEEAIVLDRSLSAVEKVVKAELPPVKQPPSDTVAMAPEPVVEPSEQSGGIPEASSTAEDAEQGPSSQASEDDRTASLELTPSIEEIESLKDKIKEEQDLAASRIIDDEKAPAVQSETMSGQEIPELGELPVEIRKNIPDISIFGHIYSNTPASRLANINGSLAREGETVTGKLRVKEITMNGIIFDYEGLYFRVRAF